MNTRNLLLKLSLALALVALIASGAIWQLGRVHAMPTAVEDQATFGMVGITRGQTVRLNLVNLIPPGRLINLVPPGPCRVVLSFRDASGQPFTDSNGQVIRSEVSLEAGESAFLDLNGDLFAGGLSTNGDTRLQLRPFVRVTDAPSGNQIPPGPCRATMEVFDNASGRTSIFATGTPTERPDDQQ